FYILRKTRKEQIKNMAQDELNDRIYSNTDKASVHNIDLAFLFSTDQLKALARYKDSGPMKISCFFRYCQQ
ncbi:unnamed protein product, partial [Didymodactylos carnosus]